MKTYALVVVGSLAVAAAVQAQTPQPKPPTAAGKVPVPLNVKNGWAPPRTADGQPDLQGTWVNFDSTPFETPGVQPPQQPAAAPGRRPGAALGRPCQPDAGAAQVDGGRSAGRESPGHAVGRGEARLRPGASRGLVGARDALGAVHHARRSGRHVPGRLQQRLPDPADPGLRGDPLRDDSRSADHPDRRPSAPSRRTSVSGMATRAAVGKAIRWSSTPPTSTTGARSRPVPRPDASAASRTARRCTWSSGSRRPTRTRSNYEVTIDDPKVYTRPWKVAIPLTRDSNYQMYEYSCQEGNYALPNALSAGRAREKAEAAAARIANRLVATCYHKARRSRRSEGSLAGTLVSFVTF